MGFCFGACFVFKEDVVAYFFVFAKTRYYGFPFDKGMVVVWFKLYGKDIGYALFGFAIGRVSYYTCTLDSLDLNDVRRRVVVINDIDNIILDLFCF